MLNIPSDQICPVLPLRDVVVFPHMVVPLFVGRDKSIKALDSVMMENKQIFLVTQKTAELDEPRKEDLYQIGTLANILQLLKLPDGTVKVLVEGQTRAKINQFTDNEDYFEAYVDSLIEDMGDNEVGIEGLARVTLSHFESYIKLNRKVPPEVISSVQQITTPSRLADTIASHLSIKLSEKQVLLETLNISQRLEKIYAHLDSEMDVIQVEKRIRNRVKRQMEKTQREYYLNEQMKAIQKELGEGEGGKDELSEIESRIKKTKLSKEARERAEAELKKLRHMSPMAAEATIVRNYLDWLLNIPWNKQSKVQTDIKRAQKILDADHYGLEKVKERIVEYLAVQQKTKSNKGPILCFVGPPGVGKTSLGKSIARATGRNFVRISLGGVRDESEIRGHRRTYIGSMPGKIIQGMKKAKTSNPLFLLDEIDKLGSDWRGDPSSALLEVLDPAQNHTFNDHYLEVDYDLSKVMFVCTANSLRLPQPLLDRMEIIRISGYTEDEKVEIAERHLLPKQMKENGLNQQEWSISKTAIYDIIRYYTREAGVRNLERELANLARKSVKELLLGLYKHVSISTRNLAKYSGVRKFRYGQAELDNMIGVTTGLAWTEVGGEILSIEALMLPGKGRMMITGKLGEVMQESIKAASSYVRSQAVNYGIKPTIFEKKDIHIHVPEGATPKDGPSAGVAMITSIVSVLTGIPVSKSVAMTGEISLRGRVMAIGGLKEKLLAALRAGIKTVLIPKENEKDLAEIPENVKKGLEIIPVSHVNELLKLALTRPLTPIEWVEPEETPSTTPSQIDDLEEDGSSARLPH